MIHSVSSAVVSRIVNGELVCTFADFEAYGVYNRHQIAPAIRELAALGFIEVTRKGAAGNADHRQAAMYLLTYRPFGSAQYRTNGWRRIGSLEEAERVAKVARAKKADARAREFGRRGGIASRAKKRDLGARNDTEVSVETTLRETTFSLETTPRIHGSPRVKTTPLSRVSPVGPAQRADDDAAQWAASLPPGGADTRSGSSSLSQADRYSSADLEQEAAPPSTVEALARYAELSVIVAQLVDHGAPAHDVLPILSGQCPMPVSLDRQLRCDGDLLMIDDPSSLAAGLHRSPGRSPSLSSAM
jgi:hypothetical protein